MAGEESGKSRLRKTVRNLKELDKMENMKESGKVQEVVEVAEVEVNEGEEEWMTEEESRRGDEGGELDPERHGRCTRLAQLFPVEKCKNEKMYNVKCKNLKSKDVKGKRKEETW